MQRFVDEYDLVQHTLDQTSYTFELYSDEYQDKMYIFPGTSTLLMDLPVS